MSVTAAHPQLVRRSAALGVAKTIPGAFYLLSAMAIALTIWTPGFFTAANLTNVTLQVAVLTIVALGMTLVILTEGIDLSLGPVLGLCGVAASLLVVSGHSLVTAIAGALAVGVLRNGLNLVGVSTEWQVAIVGIVIISAVGVDSLRGLNA